METKINTYIMTACSFLDKKHVVDTKDSTVDCQNTMNKSQPNSEPATNDNVLTLTVHSNSEDVIQLAATNRKNLQGKRKRIRDKDKNFGGELLNMFKENTKLM